MTRVFISSVLGGLKAERQQLADTLRAAGFDAWLSEERHPRLGVKPANKGEWSRRVCLQAVRESDVYVGLFSVRYGGSAGQHHAHIALTELELYEAFRRGKPLLLYVLDSSARERPLRDSLAILRELVPERLHDVGTIHQVRDRVARDIARLRRGAIGAPWTRPAFGLFFDRLVRGRHYQAESGGMRFLDNHFPPPSAEMVDAAWVDEELRLLPSVESYADRLDAAWNVIRALCATPWTEHRDDPRTLRQWDQALHAWGRSAAWTGLHGPLLAGTLSAFHSLLDIRTLRTSRGRKEDWVAQAEAMGPLASAYYSMAIRCRGRPHRDFYLRRSLDLLDAVKSRAMLLGNEPGELGRDAIRGHILLRLGNRVEAMDVFQRSLRRRADLGMGGDAIAEARGDLGWALVRTGRLAEGIDLLHEAVEQLEHSTNPESAGFLIRAKLKLAQASIHDRGLRRAAKQLSEVQALCVAVGAWDQWSKVGVKGRLLAACLGSRFRAERGPTGFRYVRE